MLKKLTIAASVSVFLLTASFLAYVGYKNEQYIASIESQLNVTLTENAWLEEELEDKEEELTKANEQLLISNDQLKMIEMRNEGIEYQEDME